MHKMNRPLNIDTQYNTINEHKLIWSHITLELLNTESDVHDTFRDCVKFLLVYQNFDLI